MAKGKPQSDGLMSVVMLSTWAEYKIGACVELNADIARQLIENKLADGSAAAVAAVRKGVEENDIKADL